MDAEEQACQNKISQFKIIGGFGTAKEAEQMPPKYSDKNLEQKYKEKNTDLGAIKEQDILPKSYDDGSFRTRKSGIMEYRFKHLGNLKSVYGYSEQECWNKRTMFTKTGKTEPASSSKITLGQWLLFWAEKYKKHKLTEDSYINLTGYINNHIIPILGKKQLNKVTSDELQDFINGLPSDSLREKAGSVLSDSFNKAFNTQRIKFNPYPAVEFKRGKANHYPPLHPADEAEYLQQMKKQFSDLFLFCCCTGLRLGEALGLHIINIDFDRYVIIVQEQMTKRNKISPYLKTDASYREVPFLPQLFSLIDFDPKGKRLFDDITNVSANSYMKRIKDKKDCRFKNIVWHSARHTFSSACYHIGIKDKQIQIWLGHEKVETTIDIYTHILKSEKHSLVLEYLTELGRSLDLI